MPYIATASRTGRQATMRKIPAVDPTQLVCAAVVLRARYKVHYGPADLRGRYKIYIYNGREDSRDGLYIIYGLRRISACIIVILYIQYIYIYARRTLAE